MRLKVTKEISKKIIIAEIETADFTLKENKMLDMLGEPVITFKKTYYDKYEVDISKKIRSGFKFKVRFDGTLNIEEANDAIMELCRDDLRLILQQAMAEVKAEYEKIEFGDGVKPVEYIPVEY